MAKLDGPSGEREECVVVSTTDVRPRVEVCPPLAHNDFASFNNLATKALHSQVLGVGVATVSSRGRSFFVCHEISCSFLPGLLAPGNSGYFDAGQLRAETLTLVIPGLVLEFVDSDFRPAQVF